MDAEEAKWIIDLFKTIQIAYVADAHLYPVIKDDDIERMESFISRIRVTMKSK